MLSVRIATVLPPCVALMLALVANEALGQSVDCPTLAVRSLQVRVQDSQGVPIPKARVSVLIVTGTTSAVRLTDENGTIILRCAPGYYKLLVSYPGFCPSLIPFHVVRWPRGGFFHARRVVVEMHGLSLDCNSCGAYK